ncbi:unnamed protein product [Prorocentrum cordatum]|uniref:Thiol oxidase n=1 Tax=Prorocentrum cordatum TaxID=2364126 RepID=A0ABN9PQY4_9DINO|nr:unnamed protein product [Polarella glacialis]
MVPLVVPLLLNSCLALQTSVTSRLPAAGCRDAVPGDWCHTALAWAKEKGATEHPEWFPGDVGEYTARDFQSLMHQLGVAQCTPPCAPEHVERQHAVVLLQSGEALAQGFGASELEELLASTWAPRAAAGSPAQSPDGPAAAASMSDCEDAAEGSLCHRSVAWLRESGFAMHPDWYPGLSSDTPFEHVQMILYSLGKVGCKKPCQKALEMVPDGQYNSSEAVAQPPHSTCGDAAPGGWCSKSIQWLRFYGFAHHPDWYPSLGPGSTDREMQTVLHQHGKAQCPKPCSERGAIDALEEPAVAAEPAAEPEPPRAAELVCSTAGEGSACFDEVVAQMEGVREHPELHPWITNASSFEEVQGILFDRMEAGCTRPCPAENSTRLLADGGSEMKKPYGEMTMEEAQAYMDGKWDGMGTFPESTSLDDTVAWKATTSAPVSTTEAVQTAEALAEDSVENASAPTSTAVQAAEADAEDSAQNASEPKPSAHDGPSAAWGATETAAVTPFELGPSVPVEVLPVDDGMETRAERVEGASGTGGTETAVQSRAELARQAEPGAPEEASAGEPAAAIPAVESAPLPEAGVPALDEEPLPLVGESGVTEGPAREAGSQVDAELAARPVLAAEEQSNASQPAEVSSSAAMPGSANGDAVEPTEDESDATGAAPEADQADVEVVSLEPLPLVAGDEVVHSAVEEQISEETQNRSGQELLKDSAVVLDTHADVPAEVANETSEALEGMAVSEIREDLSNEMSASTAHAERETRTREDFVETFNTTPAEIPGQSAPSETLAEMERRIREEVLTGMTASTTPAEISAGMANESEEDRLEEVSVSTAPAEPPAGMFSRIREKVLKWMTASTTTAGTPSDKAPQIGEDARLKEIAASTPAETPAEVESRTRDELLRESAAETTVPLEIQDEMSASIRAEVLHELEEKSQRQKQEMKDGVRRELLAEMGKGEHADLPGNKEDLE